MKLELNRAWFTELSTGGKLSVDGVDFCVTLELPKKDGLPGSCIPTGTYSVIETWSPKFGRNMPLIVGIPGRSEIRIHWGNFENAERQDVDGCIAVGQTHSDNFISNSVATFVKLWAKIEPALHANECTITVVDGPGSSVADIGV